MKPILLFALLAASGTRVCAGQVTTVQDSDSSGTDVIFLQEIGMGRALQSHDLMAFQSLLLPDYIEVEKTIQTREQLMANRNTRMIASYKLRNHQTRMIRRMRPSSPKAASARSRAASRI